MNTLSQENQTLLVNTITANNGQDAATVINAVKAIAAATGIEEGLAIAFADNYIKTQMATPAPDTSIKNLQDFVVDPVAADAASKASTDKKIAAAQQQAINNATQEQINQQQVTQVGTQVVVNPGTTPLQALAMEKLSKEKEQIFQIAAGMGGEKANIMLTGYATANSINTSVLFEEFRLFCMKPFHAEEIKREEEFIDKELPFLSKANKVSFNKLAVFLSNNYFAYRTLKSPKDVENIYSNRRESNKTKDLLLFDETEKYVGFYLLEVYSLLINALTKSKTIKLESILDFVLTADIRFSAPAGFTSTETEVTVWLGNEKYGIPQPIEFMKVPMNIVYYIKEINATTFSTFNKIKFNDTFKTFFKNNLVNVSMINYDEYARDKEQSLEFTI